jgi:hypothetical protein
MMPVRIITLLAGGRRGLSPVMPVRVVVIGYSCCFGLGHLVVLMMLVRIMLAWRLVRYRGRRLRLLGREQPGANHQPKHGHHQHPSVVFVCYAHALPAQVPILMIRNSPLARLTSRMA